MHEIIEIICKFLNNFISLYPIQLLHFDHKLLKKINQQNTIIWTQPMHSQNLAQDPGSYAL